MQRKLIYLAAILLFCLACPALFAQECECKDSFVFVKRKIEQSYSGFSQKVTQQTRAEYEQHTQNYQMKADSAKDDKQCFALCFEWMKWFKDRHLQIGPDLTQRTIRPDSDFSLSKLDSQTLLFCLPSMDKRYQEIINKRLNDNKWLLESMPFLIIDCRGNTGGALTTWRPLKKYLYTNPTLTDGYLYWASEDNAAFMLKSAKTVKGRTKFYYKKMAKAMKKSPGTFIGTMNASRQQFRAITHNPQKVTLLVNRRCASSCEMFLLWAKQSKKVTIIGETTAGIIDYGALNGITVPCHNWAFRYPTARSNRVPDGRGLDNIGIEPDVCIDSNVADWIAFAREWLLRKSHH